VSQNVCFSDLQCSYDLSVYTGAELDGSSQLERAFGRRLCGRGGGGSCAARAAAEDRTGASRGLLTKALTGALSLDDLVDVRMHGGRYIPMKMMVMQDKDDGYVLPFFPQAVDSIE
jgi:hypothetical protein